VRTYPQGALGDSCWQNLYFGQLNHVLAITQERKSLNFIFFVLVDKKILVVNYP
jgi:hypothetical protein